MKQTQDKVTKKYQHTDAALAALKALVNRLHEIHSDEHYKSVWASYMIHGGDYSDGPKYDKELAAADEVLHRNQ